MARLARLLSPSAGGLMWRNAKADVAEQLGIPAQRAVTTQLQLSAVERHFYGRQHKVRTVGGACLPVSPLYCLCTAAVPSL